MTLPVAYCLCQCHGNGNGNGNANASALIQMTLPLALATVGVVLSCVPEGEQTILPLIIIDMSSVFSKTRFTPDLFCIYKIISTSRKKLVTLQR